MSDASGETKVAFKPRKKIIRTKRRSSGSSSDEEEASVLSKLNEAKLLQTLRKRPKGVSVVSLAIGQKVPETENSVTDPFKVKTGGLVNMNVLKSGTAEQTDDAYDTGIGTQFSAETNKRDEDEEMMKYIEEQLSKRKGSKEDGEKSTPSNDSKYCSPEEAALQAVPDHLRSSSTHRSEEMLSNQMLSGIPEIDLGIEVKIKNIEATEEAKLKLLAERRNKKDGPSQFVPTNMAVNFVQHNRFNIEESGPPKKREKVEVEEVKPSVEASSFKQGNKEKKPPANREKATDDYHYEKFKKQFRRY